MTFSGHKKTLYLLYKFKEDIVIEQICKDLTCPDLRKYPASERISEEHHRCQEEHPDKYEGKRDPHRHAQKPVKSFQHGYFFEYLYRCYDNEPDDGQNDDADEHR